MQIISLVRYQYRLLRKEQLWAPFAIWFFFTIAALLMRGEPGGVNLFESVLALVPLIIAGLAPSLVVDDPALELSAATPLATRTYITARTIGLFLLALVLVGALWIVAIAFGIAGPLAALGWVTLLPAMALAALSATVGSLSARSALGIAASAGVWVFQAFYGDLLLASETGKLFHLYLGLKLGLGPSLWENHYALGAVALVLFAATSRLLKREERFLG